MKLLLQCFAILVCSLYAFSAESSQRVRPSIFVISKEMPPLGKIIEAANREYFHDIILERKTAFNKYLPGKEYVVIESMDYSVLPRWVENIVLIDTGAVYVVAYYPRDAGVQFSPAEPGEKDSESAFLDDNRRRLVAFEKATMKRVATELIPDNAIGWYAVSSEKQQIITDYHEQKGFYNLLNRKEYAERSKGMIINKPEPRSGGVSEK